MSCGSALNTAAKSNQRFLKSSALLRDCPVLDKPQPKAEGTGYINVCAKLKTSVQSREDRKGGKRRDDDSKTFPSRAQHGKVHSDIFISSGLVFS